MSGFTLLWSKTLDSTIWRRESKETRLLWMAMLMMKDSEGNIQSSKPGLADRAKLTDEETESALAVLMAPDPNSTTKDEDGRRVVEIPGGWRVVNHDLYRFSTEAKRLFWRQQKAEQRAALESVAKRRKKPTKSKGQVSAEGRDRERRFCEADAAGQTDKAAEIAAEGISDNGAPKGEIA